jgi:GNAT superfamily N-acetyltransferase
MTGRGAGRYRSAANRYRSAAGKYRSTLWLCGLVLAGWLWDLALGGARVHALAWLAALLLVGGVSALIARQRPSQQVEQVSADQERSASQIEKPPTGKGESRKGKITDSHQTDVVPRIRPATPVEYPALIEIEEAADRLFDLAGYGSTPGPASVADLSGAQLVLVAGDPPVGYARMEVVDGRAHLESLSVRPSSMRRGIGSALVQAICDQAEAAGYTEITLCTFAEVPWNGPFYAGLGFAELAELSPGLRELRAAEQEVGLDAMGRRMVMIRSLSAGSGPKPAWKTERRD